MKVRQKGESLFIAFRHGSVNRIDMNIVDNINELLSDLNTNNLSLKDILKAKIKKNDDGWGEGISNQSIWFKMIDELNNESQAINFDRKILIEIFEIIVQNPTERKLWKNLKKMLIDKIKTISGWEDYYRIRSYSMITNVKRCSDGSYVGRSDGEKVILLGHRTDREEKYDYIVKSLLDEYGHMQLLLKFISIIMITINYNRKPSEYPNTVNIYLGENSNYYTWFLHWKWHINRPFGYMPIGWRPQNVLCDPEWLASDLLANFCKKKKISIPNEPIFEKPSNKLLDEYKKNFTGPERSQLACVVDTNLCLSTDGEKYIDYKGAKIRWLDPTLYREAVIVTPITSGLNKNEIDQKLMLIDEFISMMVFNYDLPIVKQFPVIGPASYTPMAGSTRGASCFMHTGKVKSINNVNTKMVKLMLSFYKEAINSASIYYKVLNFTKIIEAYARVPEEQIRLINESVDFLMEKGHGERITDILNSDGNLGEYIYNSCRCAIAHTGKKHNISPDNINDYYRMTLDEPLIKCLAREIIVRKSEGIKMLNRALEK